jgi:hypothetical protein
MVYARKTAGGECGCGYSYDDSRESGCVVAGARDVVVEQLNVFTL